MSVKISNLPAISAASIVTANVSAIPLIAGSNVANATTYQTSMSNVKSYIETGNLNVSGAVNANLTSTFANLIITGNLNVQGTTTSTSSENLSTNSSIIDLHTFTSNLDPWTTDDGRDIGLRFFWYKDSTAGASALVWENDNSRLTWYGSGVGNSNVGTVTGTFGTFQTGQILIDNSTATTANATGALQVSGGTSVGGNIWAGGNANIVGAISGQTLAAIGSATVGSNLSVAGSATAQSLVVNTVATVGSTLVVSGTATLNALSVNTTASVTGNITSGNIRPSANVTYNIGTNTSRYSTVYAQIFSGQAATALYADLAEKYQGDADYPPATVVIFGGSKEITVTDVEQDTRVAGVVSTAPAYLMNAESNGIPVALRGKVPIKVIGPVTKGCLLVTSTIPGHAIAVTPGSVTNACAVIAKSLEDNFAEGSKIITAVIV